MCVRKVFTDHNFISWTVTFIIGLFVFKGLNHSGTAEIHRQSFKSETDCMNTHRPSVSINYLAIVLLSQVRICS